MSKSIVAWRDSGLPAFIMIMIAIAFIIGFAINLLTDSVPLGFLGGVALTAFICRWWLKRVGVIDAKSSQEKIVGEPAVFSEITIEDESPAFEESSGVIPDDWLPEDDDLGIGSRM